MKTDQALTQGSVDDVRISGCKGQSTYLVKMKDMVATIKVIVDVNLDFGLKARKRQSGIIGRIRNKCGA
jgi:hypothetical protein